MGFVDKLKSVYTDEELKEYATTIVSDFKERCLKHKSDKHFSNKEAMIKTPDDKETKSKDNKKLDNKSLKSIKYKYDISEFYEYDINKIKEYVESGLDQEHFDHCEVKLKFGYDDEITSSGLFINPKSNGTMGIIIYAEWRSAKRAIEKQNRKLIPNTSAINDAIVLFVSIALIVYIIIILGSFL